MSTFKTIIHVNIQEAISKLPKRSYVESVTINPERTQAEILWGCDDIKTGFTFPVDYPLSKLETHEPPKEVMPAKSEPLEAQSLPPSVPVGPSEAHEPSPTTTETSVSLKVDTGRKARRK